MTVTYVCSRAGVCVLPVNCDPILAGAPALRRISVGIATGYGLHDLGVEVLIPIGSRIFISSYLQTGCVADPASYPVGTAGAFPWG
jgi:hypothetical protein